MPTVWIITDSRYLRQRMPAVLVPLLSEAGVATTVVAADDLMTELGNGGPLAAAGDGDAVLARTRNPLGLNLIRGATRPGVHVLTPIEPIEAVRDKARATQALLAHDLPAPRTFLADHPGALSGAPPECFPLLLKPHKGDNAAGITVVQRPADLDDVPWSGGMVLAQPFVDTGGVDLKLYAVEDTVWAVRRPSPLSPPGAHALPVEGERAEVTPELARIAHGCRRLFGLDLLGIDVLESPEGPLIIDVNEFPNYTGIDEAPERAATFVRSRLAGAVPAGR